MAAGLTVGGWFATAFLDALVDKASSYALEQFGLQSGLHVDLQRLRISLTKVRILIGGAEERQLRGASYILKQLKEAAYDADDLLDEFEYHRLKLKVERIAEHRSPNQAGDVFSSLLNFTNSLFDDAVMKIHEIQERLDSSYAELKDAICDIGYEGRKARTEVVRFREETSSLLTEPEVFGRCDERDRVVELLLKSGDGSESCNKSVSILPIVGIGGVGKTTLAQLVYQDPRIDAYFQLKMWVCASNPFDVKRIIRELIEYFPGQRHSNVTNLNRLQFILMEELSSRRFLVVLDDVWNEESRKWKDLIAPLMVGMKGSKILLTTRSQKVADAQVADNMKMIEPVFLNGLQIDAFWPFFRKCAFGCRKLAEPLKLEIIGKKIAGTLKGSPLAAKTVGSLLNSSMDVAHWRSIMNSELWELPQNENDILPVLKLSYHNLSASLKQCFAYCSLFPKDHKLDKDGVIQMWMAQGFLTAQKNKRMEDVGNEYFYDLHCMAFFQKHSQWGDRYVMHDLLHDLARFVSTTECFAVEDGKLQEIPETVRHLSICTNKLDPSKVAELSKYEKLRTLIFVNGFGDGPGRGSMLNDILQKLTRMRVLHVGDHKVEELPGSIGNLKHLRYLSILCPDIVKIPQSLCNLHNLQVLKLDWSSEPFPKSTTNLISLRHIDADADAVSEIIEIGKLTALQTLRIFKVANESGRTIKELKNLNQLHGQLTILNLESIGSKDDAHHAMLSNKQNLNSLCLQWASGRDSNIGIELHDADILENLQPPPSLAELEIKCYAGVTSPSWLENPLLLDLESVCLKGCKSWKQLPCLGKLPFLKVLKINSMQAVTRLDSMYSVTPDFIAFPSLENLELEDMPECEEWGAMPEGSDHFPRLQKMHIKNFPQLSTLSYLGRLPSLKSLHLASLPRAKQIGQELYGNAEFTAFPLLEELSVKNMPECQVWYAPEHGRKAFPRLRSLRIEDCPKLKEIPSLSPLLENLELHNVGLRELPGSWSGSSSHITLNSTPHENNSIEGIFLSVSISDCHCLTSIGKWLLQDFLPMIQKLSIINCEEFSSLPAVRFKDLVNLEYLEISECQNLSSGITTEEHRVLLPTSLRVLVLHLCGNLNLSLPCSLKILPILSILEITGYPHVKALPTEILRHLTALEDLTIKDCQELRSLGALRYLTSLKSLTILQCPRLTASLHLTNQEELANDLSSLLSLWVDDTSLLMIRGQQGTLSSLQQLAISHSLQLSLFRDEEESKWLKNLTSLEVLRLIDCSNLQSLPLALSTMPTLKSITVDNCMSLKSLSENDIPGSIEELIFWNCHPDLEDWCQKDLGTDTSIVARIPWIRFDGFPIIAS